MTFNPNSQLDSSQVSRGRGAPVMIGGGIGGVALLVLGLIFFGPKAVLNQLGSGEQSE